MDFGSVITTSIVGNFSYDIVKNGLQLSVENILKLTREKAIEWLYEDEATEKIARRINELSYLNDESQKQYKERLDSDVVLNELLKQLSHGADPVNIHVEQSEKFQFAVRDFHQVINNNSTDTKPKKS